MSGINYLLDTNFILGILKSSPAVLAEISERKILSGSCAFSNQRMILKWSAGTRYNLAYINHRISHADNGRVIGYDNHHGRHHRHDRGRIESVEEYFKRGRVPLRGAEHAASGGSAHRFLVFFTEMLTPAHGSPKVGVSTLYLQQRTQKWRVL